MCSSSTNLDIFDPYLFRISQQSYSSVNKGTKSPSSFEASRKQTQLTRFFVALREIIQERQFHWMLDFIEARQRKTS